MPDSTEEPLTGSELLQRRITLATGLTGAAVAMWSVPVCLLFLEAPRGVYVLTVGLISSLSIGTFLVGLVFRAQRFNTVYRERVEAEADRWHNELVAQFAYMRDQVGKDHYAIHRDLDALARALDNVATRVERIAPKVEQERWNAYSEGIADVLGGEQVVNGTDTRQLSSSAGRVQNVVPLPKAHNGRR